MIYGTQTNQAFLLKSKGAASVFPPANLAVAKAEGKRPMKWKASKKKRGK